MKEKMVCVLSGYMPHHLDHLAPFAWWSKSPLWIEDPQIAHMARHYYPDVEVIEGRFVLEDVAREYNLIAVSTKTAGRELKAIFTSMGHEKMKVAFVPHGQSDKGLINPEMRCIEHTDIAFVYGALQKERLKECRADQTIGEIRTMGNVRRSYYEAHKEYLDKVTAEEVFSDWDFDRKTVLYAPTWAGDTETATFIHHAKELMEGLSERVNLVVKLHPLSEKTHPAHTVYLTGFDKAKRGLRVIDGFPLVYPILEKTDIYIGDESAVGYDFLPFNRPMLFLTKADVPLHACGYKTESVQELLSIMEGDQSHLKQVRQDCYNRAYEIIPRVIEDLGIFTAGAPDLH